jgi:hypothetical protein
MKIIELTSKINISVTNEEYTVLGMMGDKKIAKSQLSERQQLIANQLVNKDLLIRTNNDGIIHYQRANRN